MRINEIDFSVKHHGGISGGQSQEPKPKKKEIPKLRDIATIKTNFPDADFWIQRVGDKETVGRVKDEFNRGYIGVKVTDTKNWLPTIVKYMLMIEFNKGYYLSKANGMGPRVNIRVSDVADIEIHIGKK